MTILNMDGVNGGELFMCISNSLATSHGLFMLELSGGHNIRWLTMLQGVPSVRIHCKHSTAATSQCVLLGCAAVYILSYAQYWNEYILFIQFGPHIHSTSRAC